MVVELVAHCHSLAVICVWFAQQRNQNCRTLSVCWHFVASFYRHVTNIVAEFVTSVILSYHLIAAMCLSYVRQSNYIVTLTSLSPFCQHVLLLTDVVVELVAHCHSLAVICVWFAQQRNQNCRTLSVCCHCCIFLPSWN